VRNSVLTSKGHEDNVILVRLCAPFGLISQVPNKSTRAGRTFANANLDDFHKFAGDFFVQRCNSEKNQENPISVLFPEI